MGLGGVNRKGCPHGEQRGCCPLGVPGGLVSGSSSVLPFSEEANLGIKHQPAPFSAFHSRLEAQAAF